VITEGFLCKSDVTKGYGGFSDRWIQKRGLILD
jgi:hypothetical protein